MIEHCARPGVGAVAVIALITAGDVVGGFAFGLLAVVATGTAAEYRRMVHPGHRTEGVGAMTVLTEIGGGDVTGGFALGL